MSFNYVFIGTVKGNDYRILILHMNKAEAKSLLGNADLTEKILRKK